MYKSSQSPGPRNIIVIGASAGGLRPLLEIVAHLPAELPAAVFIVMHQPAFGGGDLGNLIEKNGMLPAHYAVEGERIIPGQIYIGPLDKNLLVERGHVLAQRSPKEFWTRPGIDPLFRSAAAAYGVRVAGVILSGTLRDGTAGLWEIKRHGGIAIVQDPKAAEHQDMPKAALESVQVDYCLPASEIAPVLCRLARPQPDQSTSEGPQQAKVLIVEDQRIVARNLANRLREFNYDVIASVGSGEEAVVAAETGPDIVLMDIRLAGKVDGIEAAKIVWDRFQIPVVYITAHGDTDAIEKLKSTPAYGYVGKPLRPIEVHAAIQLALHRRNTELSAF